MKSITKKWKFRILSVITGIAILLSSFYYTTAFAAGVETLYKGINDIGTFTFTDTNTTPIKTINGTQVTFNVTWRASDGFNGIPDIDRGISEAKLTMQIIDATTGKALTNKIVFMPDISMYFTTVEISANVKSGQKVKVWFDASSIGESNGTFRAITVRSFYATVN